MKLLPLLFLFLLAACAGDPYLARSIDCVSNAQTRAQADACRAALARDAGVGPSDASHSPLVLAPLEGGVQ